MNSIKIEFGKCLKNIRKSKHITQEELAEKIEINVRQLARIEAGESFVTAETLQKICNALNVKPKVFFDFYEDESTNVNFDKDIRELKNKINLISKDKNKIEFLNIAMNSLTDKESLKELKLLIKGLELTM